MDLSLVLAVPTLILAVWISLEVGWGLQLMEDLRAVPPLGGSDLPRVSVIVPACNEERSIETALSSVLGLDYPDLEIVVVDDRSTDGTGDILDALARAHPRLKALHVRDLPRGWLGKTHALQLGADHASGAYLLFTDADVTFEPSTLRRAVGRMVGTGRDHLCLVFRAEVPGGLLNAAIIEFGGALFWMFKPWKAVDPASPRHMGVGAFNLVRREAYAAVDGHRSVSICPVDDIMLGKRIKNRGFRQECMIGYDFVSVPWYGSVSEMADGLQKNIFAGYGFSLARYLLASGVQLLMGIWPLFGLFLTSGVAQVLNGLIVGIRFGSVAQAARQASVDASCAFWSPLSSWVLLYISSRAVFATLLRGGITWRGTFYPLGDLKGCRD